MTRREEIRVVLGDALELISTANGGSVDFDKLTYWQDTDTEYQKNHLDYRDTTEEYNKHNLLYKTQLNIEITAIVFGIGTVTAPQLGTLALEDLIKAVKCLSLNDAMFTLVRSHKYVETKGKTACHIELEIAVCYKF